jgi:hypothetical protein
MTPEGMPILGLEVALLRLSYDAAARKRYQVTNTARTDDLGDYRLFGIAPGDYFLSVRTPTGPPLDTLRLILNSSLGPEEISRLMAGPGTYRTSFYPGVSRISDARSLSVRPGSELRTMDFILVKERIHQVRGQIVEERTGRPPSVPTLLLIVERQAVGINESKGAGYMDRAGEGGFEISDVLSGEYWVVARTQSSDRTSRTIGRVAVDVFDTNVDKVVLTIKRPVDGVIGRIRVEDDAQLSTIPNFTSIRVELEPPSIDTLLIGGPPRVSSQPNDDGTFSFEPIGPDEYRVVITGLPAGYFVKQATYGGVDISDGHVDLSERDEFEIIISPKGGQINGLLLNARNVPQANREVVLIPQEDRNKASLYRTAITDGEGRFYLNGIVPGKYKLLSWRHAAPYFYFDGETLGPRESEGTSLDIGSSAVVRATVRMSLP